MKRHLFFISLFIILIVLLNLPVVFSPNHKHKIPAFFSTDEPYAAIWDFWRIQYSYNNHLDMSFTNLINYPSGVNLFSSGYVSYVWSGINNLLAVITTPALTYNIQILMNFFLSALFIYLLTFFLTKSRLAGLFSGIVFSFSPQHFVRSWQHLGLTYWQWIPLILLSVILLKEKFTKKKVVLFFISILLLFSFDYSIMYLGMVSLAAFLIYIIFYNWRIKFFKKPKLIRRDARYIGKIFIIGLVTFLVLLPQFYPIIRNYFNPSLDIEPSGFNPYHRPFEDLFTQSAKPLSYLLPSTEHPILGSFTEHFVGSHLWGISFTEHQLYLGWTTLFLAFYTMKQWRRKRKSQVTGHKSQENQMQERDDFYIGYFIFLAIVSWLFSQPPWWQFGRIKIYLPSYFMYKILPMYRAYCRFGIVVLFALAVLAGYGLKFILERQKTKIKKYLTAGFFCGLIIFEFWFNPLTHYIDLSKYPKVYDWLKNQKQVEVIVEYPMPKEGVNEKYKFYQTIHHKKLINGATPGVLGYSTKLKILNPAEKDTPTLLKVLGTNYIIVHTTHYKNSENYNERIILNNIRKHLDLELIKLFPDGIEVYEIK